MFNEEEKINKIRNIFGEHIDILRSDYNTMSTMEENFISFFDEDMNVDKLEQPNVGVVMNIYNDISDTIKSNPLMPKLISADKPASVPYYEDLKFLSVLANTSIKAIDDTIALELANFNKLWTFITNQWSSLIEYSKDPTGKRKPFILETLLIMVIHHAEILIRELILFINRKFMDPKDNTTFSKVIDKNNEYKDLNEHVRYINDNMGELKKLTNKDRIGKMKKDKRIIEESLDITHMVLNTNSLEESMAMVSNIIESKVVTVLGVMESYVKSFKSDVNELFSNMINAGMSDKSALMYVGDLKNVLSDTQNAVQPDMIKDIQKNSIKYTNLYNKTKNKDKPKKILLKKI